MLTKNDLQQLKTILRDEVRPIVKEEVYTVINETVRPMIKEELKPIKDDITQIRKDMKQIVSFFDREYLELRKRVEHIEQHLGIHSATS